jgi:small-conductance mechanosensitive channel
LLAAAIVAVVLAVAGPLVRVVLRRSGHPEFASDLERLTWPVRFVAAGIVGRVAVEPLDRPGLAALCSAAIIAAVAWMLLQALIVGQEALFRQLDIGVADNRRARSRRTQIELLRRILAVFVVLAAALVALLSLTPLERFGPSLVAYAGLIGVVLGLALRAPLENLAAGVVIAVSEPISIDDVVVVEGEWGRIEQIGLVNVVVRLWDDRRLVLPTSRFANESFENWTKSSSSVTGQVLLWVDYRTDVAAARAELERIVRHSRRWDGRFCNVQVVELTERAVQLRVLATARDASLAFDLRCEVREEFLRFLAHRPDSLPVVRTLPVDGASPRRGGGWDPSQISTISHAGS